MFPKNPGLIVPKCSPVLNRPLSKPPITPLALRIAGYMAIAQGVDSNSLRFRATIVPAAIPTTLKAYAVNDSLIVLPNLLWSKLEEVSANPPNFA